MIGDKQKLQPKLFYHCINLEHRIPDNHPLRKIDRVVDFNFVRTEVQSLYGTNGNKSVDPIVILKLMFLLFFENVSSERALMSQLPYRFDWLWFCGYDLDDTTPNHSIISKARKRWGADIFEKFFVRILEQCMQAGLVGGDVVHLDSSLIDADASKDRLIINTELATEQTCGRLDEPISQNKPKKITPVDPDATLTKKNGKTVLGYKNHRGVDDKHGIITATITTAANRVDGDMLKDVLERHCENVLSKPSISVADRAYGIGFNYRYLREKGIIPCINHQRKACNCDKEFSNDSFTYDKQQDIFVCPAGQVLEYRHYKESEGRYIYRAKREICLNCPYTNKCLTGKTNGRQVQRSIYEDDIRYADTVVSSFQTSRLLARRKHCVEGSFADAANNHGFKRARWRGLVKVSIQNLMIAAVQNLRKLIRIVANKTKYLGKLFAIFRFYSFFLSIREIVMLFVSISDKKYLRNIPSAT